MKCILLLSFVALCYSYQYQYGPTVAPLPYGGGIYETGAGYGTVFPYTSTGITGYPSMGTYMGSYGRLWPWRMYNTLNTYGNQNLYPPSTQLYQMASEVQQIMPTLTPMIQAEREILEQQEQLQQQQFQQQQQMLQLQQVYKQQLQNYPLLQYLTPFQSSRQNLFRGPLTSGYGYTAPWTAQGYGGFQIPVVA